MAKKNKPFVDNSQVSVDFNTPITDERGALIFMNSPMKGGEPYQLTLAEAVITGLSKIDVDKCTERQRAQRGNLISKIADATEPITLSKNTCDFLFSLIEKTDYTLPIVNARCAKLLGVEIAFDESELG